MEKLQDNSAPDPFLRLECGAAVYTRDEQRIGVVKDIRGHIFKIDAPMRRDFWLAADAVLAALPDGSIQLNLDRRSISVHKVTPA